MIYSLKNLQKLGAGIVISIILLISCTEAGEQKISADDYERGKSKILQLEEKHPQQFISVKNSFKKNLLGQSVIKGKIVNAAKLATYQDIVLKFSFYSKTGVLLEEDVETIFERINAGASKNFKSKYFTPKGTDSVSILVESAVVTK